VKAGGRTVLLSGLVDRRVQRQDHVSAACSCSGRHRPLRSKSHLGFVTSSLPRTAPTTPVLPRERLLRSQSASPVGPSLSGLAEWATGVPASPRSVPRFPHSQETENHVRPRPVRRRGPQDRRDARSSLIAPIALAEAEIGPTRRNPMPPSAYDASLASRQPRDPYGSGVTQRSPRRPRDRLAALLSSTRFETSPLWSDMP
jgi:hypothetical protein